MRVNMVIHLLLDHSELKSPRVSMLTWRDWRIQGRRWHGSGSRPSCRGSFRRVITVPIHGS